MLFNSIEYIIFLPLVFLFYWFVLSKNLKLQNFFILSVSYLFYGWWDWRFLSLIAFSSFIDYLVGIYIDKAQTKARKKVFLLISLFVNLGFLAVFKYYNFFVDNFVSAFSSIGYTVSLSTIKIILPVGISFYTFQTLSYSIDVYKGKLKPTRDIISFFAFVSFFPQLVAGPIERATNLLPQFYKKREFSYQMASDGMQQILWGFFKKIVIADNAAIYVNDIFVNYADYSGSTLLLGGILFAFQIYGDFSGYSDIAIGTSKLFGFNLMQNFAFPYFSRDIAEFWRRWHISLSTWFRDYIYIPLGGSKSNKIRNVFIIFIVSGFWHGANWTFIFWGFLNALYFLPLFISKNNRKNIDFSEGKLLPNLLELKGILITFFLTVIAWIFFRADNMTHAFSYLKILFSGSLFNKPEVFPLNIIALIIVFVIIEWINKTKQYGLAFDKTPKNLIWRWLTYITIIFIILFYWGVNSQSFIYFQF